MTIAQPDWTRTKTLVQGDTFVSSNPRDVVSTVLGSCISICLFDENLQVGGINHYLLVENAGGSEPDNKYGLFAFESLLNELIKRGASRQKIKGKVFGGASIGGKFGALGPKNAAFAKKILQTEGIDFVGGDTGGTQARRLKFHPVSGDAKMALIPATDAVEEAIPMRRKITTPEIELF
jgi:chemotaxis protein CheD